VVRAGLLLLTGCEAVFPLDRPKVCAHDGLDLCLRFEDDFADGTTIDGARGFGASALGITPTVRIPGERAILVDGGSEVVLEKVNEYDYPSVLSIDLWLEVDAFTGVNQVFLDNEFQYTISIPGNDNRVHCSALIVRPEDGGAEIVFSPGAVITPGDWHHFACVYDGANLTAYTDGVVSTLVFPTRAPLNTGGTLPIRIGQAGGDPLGVGTFPVAGAVDNVRIWNRALTIDEIAKFANEEED
jgi:hypothetical protein